MAYTLPVDTLKVRRTYPSSPVELSPSVALFTGVFIEVGVPAPPPMGGILFLADGLILPPVSGAPCVAGLTSPPLVTLSRSLSDALFGT